MVNGGSGSPDNCHRLGSAAGSGGVRDCRATGEIYTNRNASAPPVSVDAAAAPVHDPAKPTAVIVLSLEGTNVADALAPYEVLADAGAFNLYTVAERREPVPMTGGVDVIPDLSFGQLTDRLHGTPDVIVVPQLHDAGEPSAAPIVEWLQRQDSQGDPLLVSVCVGAEVLASAGLVEGRPATANGPPRPIKPNQPPPNRPHPNGLATSERCSMDRAPAARTRTFPTLR